LKRGAIAFGHDVTADYEKARRREWILTNGLGGYASSTIIGANTRGYHGLLVASLPPPLTRLLLLSKVEEELHISGEQYQLSVNKYPGVIHPKGNQYLEEFRMDPLPSFQYRAGEAALRKTVFMLQGQNTTVITYELVGSLSPVQLILRPLVNCRGFHGRTRENAGWVFSQESSDEGVRIDPYEGSPRLYLMSDRGKYKPAGSWYRNMIYDEEAERGLEDREDHYSPGSFEFELESGDIVSFAASVNPFDSFSPASWLRMERERMIDLLRPEGHENVLLQWLVSAADQFIVRLPGTNEKTIVAGYHWFGEWGRDAAISLPGLTLARGRFEEAKDIIQRFLEKERKGLIPLALWEGGGATYSSVDTSLWFIYAAYKHFTYTREIDFIEEIYPQLKDAMEWYMRGTDFGIRMAEDGLVESKPRQEALTWMDARLDGIPVTPRMGKCVEVNALWYNDLRVMEHLSREIGESSETFKRLSQKVWESFNDSFWYEEGGYLYDCVDGEERDTSIRPNQILAISLTFPALARERWRSVMTIVERHLLTPYGLRTLAPQDPRYCGRYVGGPKERDASYHNGTVWTWLMGPYITAYVRSGGMPNDHLILTILEAFSHHMHEAGLGTVSEIFDGDAPHEPRGCIAQAWSVGELLRAYREDLAMNP